jgi:transposase-like protein
MARSVLDQPHYRDEEAAFAYVEKLLWPKGPVCPLANRKTGVVCASLPQKVGKLVGVRTKPSKKNPEGGERHGLYKCYHCRGQFTVRKGTVFEDSHLPMHLWLQVIYLMQSSKKAISTAQVQRLLNCSMETAWFLTHRVREMMRTDPDKTGPLGGMNVTLEADEVYIGAKAGRKKNRPPVEKAIVMTLVERDGRARSYHVPNVRAETLHRVLSKVRTGTKLMTDEGTGYRWTLDNIKSHETVNHSQDEYVRGNVHTNTVEGFFSILKRGLFGTYQHVSDHHLHRYLAEFDFRYSNRAKLGIDDTTRTNIAIQGAKGKRLTYAAASTGE